MPGPRYTIRLADTETSFPCREDETVIAAMERTLDVTVLRRNGGAVPVGCRRGGCGVCRVRVLDGPYRVEAMSRAHVSEAEQAEGYALACRIVPEGDLSLRLATRPPTQQPANETDR